MASYDNNSPVYIAVEIERNPKSKDRLVNKLRKYAAETRLDGVIYICETDALSERLRSVYNSIVLERALRIRQYGKNFILFTDGTLDPVTKTPFLFNADLDSIALNSWTNSLLKTKCVDRRNTHFASPGVCTGT
jgi:hypothetical protein